MGGGAEGRRRDGGVFAFASTLPELLAHSALAGHSSALLLNPASGPLCELFLWPRLPSLAVFGACLSSPLCADLSDGPSSSPSLTPALHSDLHILQGFAVF